MSNQSADAVFDALGEPVRRRIVELLRAGPTPVGQLAGQLPVGRTAVSKHLRVLSDAGLGEHRPAGTRHLYALAPGGLAVAQQWLIQTWDTALSQYAAAVSRDDSLVMASAGSPAWPHTSRSAPRWAASRSGSAASAATTTATSAGSRPAAAWPATAITAA